MKLSECGGGGVLCGPRARLRAIQNAGSRNWGLIFYMEESSPMSHGDWPGQSPESYFVNRADRCLQKEALLRKRRHARGNLQSTKAGCAESNFCWLDRREMALRLPFFIDFMIGSPFALALFQAGEMLYIYIYIYIYSNCDMYTCIHLYTSQLRGPPCLAPPS